MTYSKSTVNILFTYVSPARVVSYHGYHICPRAVYLGESYTLGYACLFLQLYI